MRKFVVMAVLAMALCVVTAVPAWAAPASSETLTAGSVASTQQITGGWEINKKTGTYVTKAQKQLFTKATKRMVGVKYTPVFVMSKQVVAGTNYAYFCKAVASDAKATTSWKVVIVYKALSGKAEVLAINNFNYKKISKLKNPPKASTADGAWKNLTKKYTSKVLPKTARTAFNKAAKKFVGVSLTPLVLLSTQVVAGTNYRYLCRGVIPGTGTVNYYVVDVYKNLKGAAKITACDPINMKKYLKTS